MKERPDVIVLTEEETGEEIRVNVVEQTTFGGDDYLLVTEDALEGDEAYILKCVGDDEDDVIYEFVDDDALLEALGDIFEAILAESDDDDEEE